MSDQVNRPQKNPLPLRSMLSVAVLLMTAACGGGGYGGNDAPPPPPPPPPAQIADAQFSVELIEGLGFQAGAVVGQTDASGKFRFTVGQPVQFFIGQGADRLVIGTATPTAPASGVLPFSLHGLAEAQNDADQYLGNLLDLLIALDENADVSDGIRLSAATQSAIAPALAGGKTVNFAQDPKTFDGDPVVAGILEALNRTLIGAQQALAQFSTLFHQSRSSTIALTSDGARAVVVNRQKNSVSVIRVRDANGQDVDDLIGEVAVGDEPRSVALSPDDTRAYVSNAVDGTMSIIDLTSATPQVVGAPVAIGFEPRGIAVTANGKYAFIAMHTVGKVAIVRLATLEVLAAVQTGGNPYAVAITNDGDANDLDERVFVTRLFGEAIDPARPDGFDDAKQGVVDTFNVGAAVNGAAQVAPLHLRPLASGFNADRRQFCLQTRRALQPNPGPDPLNTVTFFNSGIFGGLLVPPKNGAEDLKEPQNPTFCPDVASTDASATGPIGRVAQKVYPNMLFGALVRGPLLYVPNVGASPEPPVRFNVNVQALVGVLDRVSGAQTELSLNLNAQIAKETQPSAADETKTLDRVFLNDLVAIEADRRGRDFLFVSRGANYVLRASLGVDGKLSILDAANKATRLQTGNLPSGVVMSRDGRRAYANNELNTSITAIDLTSNVVLARDIHSSEPPAPGTQEHRNLFGKLAFFTALGVPDAVDNDENGSFDVPLRDVDPLLHRNKASDNGWSSCASCHDDGHSDNVTWIFETGPRQTIPLEGMFARKLGVPDLGDQRILNWSGVRGSNTDFNNNAIGIQGGKGFATDVRGLNRTGQVFNHGPVVGISDSLDAIQEWVATVRAPLVPDLEVGSATEVLGRVVFKVACAECHGGAKWTKSRTSPVYDNAPTFPANPIGPAFFNLRGEPNSVPPLDSTLTVKGPQIVSVARNGRTLRLLDNVGTFLAANPLELRGAAAVANQSTQGFLAAGQDGFNTPSLLGLSLSAPYFHDGSAATLEAVMDRHLILDNDVQRQVSSLLNQQDLAALLAFLRSIDEGTEPVESATDRFLQ